MGIWFLVGWEARILLLEHSVTTNQSLLEKVGRFRAVF